MGTLQSTGLSLALEVVVHTFLMVEIATYRTVIYALTTDAFIAFSRRYSLDVLAEISYTELYIRLSL
jgi:hypothetical protein